MSVSESDWIFPLADDPESVRAPRAEDDVDPAERVTSYAYPSGAMELRSAESDDAWLISRDPVDLAEEQ